VVALIVERLIFALRIGHMPDSAMAGGGRIGATRLELPVLPVRDYLLGARRDKHTFLRVGPGLLSHWLPRDGDGYFRTSGKGSWLRTFLRPRAVCNQIRAARLGLLWQGVGMARLDALSGREDWADGRLVRNSSRSSKPANLPIQLVYPHSLALSPRGQYLCRRGLSRAGKAACLSKGLVRIEAVNAAGQS